MASTIQNRYKDIDLSLTKNPKTKDIYTLTDIDAVKRSVRTLVLTKFSDLYVKYITIKINTINKTPNIIENKLE